MYDMKCAGDCGFGVGSGQGVGRRGWQCGKKTTLCTSGPSRTIISYTHYTIYKHQRKRIQGFNEICQQGRALGFDGKSLIHPKTVCVDDQAILTTKHHTHAHSTKYVTRRPPLLTSSETTSLPTNQVEAANEAFGPLDSELAHARKVLAAWEAATSQGLGM